MTSWKGNRNMFKFVNNIWILSHHQHLKKRSSHGLCIVWMTLLARCCMLDQRWTLAQDGLKLRRPAWTEITQTQACTNILLKGAQHTWRLRMLAIWPTLYWSTWTPLRRSCRGLAMVEEWAADARSVRSWRIWKISGCADLVPSTPTDLVLIVVMRLYPELEWMSDSIGMVVCESISIYM